MRAISELSSRESTPRLIANFKQPERNLLSVFMAALDIVPEFRAHFLDRCEYRAGRTCNYESYMEPHYKSPKVADVRPDGLIVCRRGSTSWSAFVEAKSGDSPIRADQIQAYAELAKDMDVDTVITISNEFASTPDELPYHLGHRQRKGRMILHFCWAEVRTFIQLFLEQNSKIGEVEKKVLQHCSAFFWHENSGIKTYDSMPADWRGFVEQASTTLGFSTNQKGITEIVHGWQQERRDLTAKILLLTHKNLEMRHRAGVRATAEERVKHDRRQLADDYILDVNYRFKESKAIIRVIADLQGCKISTALEISPPAGKKAMATVNWVAKTFAEIEDKDTKITFDWKGRNAERVTTIAELVNDPEATRDGQTEAPKSIRIIREVHNARRFKSRKLFIEDLERLVLGLARDGFALDLV